MAKAGGRRQKKARDRRTQRSPGRPRGPVGPGSRPVAAGTRRRRDRSGRASGLRRQPGSARRPPGPARDRAGTGLDPGGQPGHRRIPARVGDESLAARLAAGRAGQARRPGAVGRSRGDGRRHDHGRAARLPGRHRGRALGRPGGRARGGGAGKGRLVGERPGLSPRLVRARPRSGVHRHHRDCGRDAARIPPSARPGEAPPAARHRPACRAAAGRRREPGGGLPRPPTSGC